MLVSQTRLTDWDWLIFNGDSTFDEYYLSYDMEYDAKEAPSFNTGYALQLDLFDLQDVPF